LPGANLLLTSGVDSVRAGPVGRLNCGGQDVTTSAGEGTGSVRRASMLAPSVGDTDLDPMTSTV